MIRLLRAEVFKLRTVWSTWVLLAVTAVLVGGLSTLVGFAPRRRDVAELLVLRGSAAWFDRVFSVMTVGSDLALILGIIVVTGEYRHKTVTPTFLAEPRRGRVTAAKLIVSAAAGLVVAVVAGAVSLSLGFSVVAAGIGDTGRMLTEYRHVLPGVAAAAVLFAIYGVGLGALLKNQVVALVLGLGVSTVVEPIIDGVLPSVGRWLPGQAAQALESVTARSSGFGSSIVHLIAWWQGALVLLAYGVVLAAAGSFTTLRADVT